MSSTWAKEVKCPGFVANDTAFCYNHLIISFTSPYIAAAATSSSGFPALEIKILSAYLNLY